MRSTRRWVPCTWLASPSAPELDPVLAPEAGRPLDPGLRVDATLEAAVHAVARDALRDRTPVSLVPGVLRSHLGVDGHSCRCGHRGDWAVRLTSVLHRAGLLARAF